MGENFMDKFYKKKPISKNWLEQNHFVYSRIFSDDEYGTAYTLRFPCYRWSLYAVLDCEVTLWENGHTEINVYDSGHGRSRYAPWYIESEVHNDFIKMLEDNIENKLYKMGFKRKKK